MYVALSLLYAKASALSPAFGDRANTYLETAYRLAPDTVEVAQLRSQE